jgi:hypothetical protein
MTRELLLPLNMGENFTLCLPPGGKRGQLFRGGGLGRNAPQRRLPLKIGVRLPARVQGKFPIGTVTGALTGSSKNWLSSVTSLAGRDNCASVSRSCARRSGVIA